MNNCLVTKLNTIVDNENLGYLGKLTINYKKVDDPDMWDNRGSGLLIDVTSGKTCHVVSKGGNILTYDQTGSGSTIGNEYSQFNELFWSAENVNMKCIFDNVYDITKISYIGQTPRVGYRYFSFNLAELKYSPLTWLDVRLSNVYGDITNIGGKSMNSLYCDGCRNVTGNINDLDVSNFADNLEFGFNNTQITGNVDLLDGKWLNFKGLYLRKTLSTGHIETLLKKMLDNGRSHDLYFNIGNSKITIKDSPVMLDSCKAVFNQENKQIHVYKNYEETHVPILSYENGTWK